MQDKYTFQLARPAGLVASNRFAEAWKLLVRGDGQVITAMTALASTELIPNSAPNGKEREREVNVVDDI